MTSRCRGKGGRKFCRGGETGSEEEGRNRESRWLQYVKQLSSLVWDVGWIQTWFWLYPAFLHMSWWAYRRQLYAWSLRSSMRQSWFSREGVLESRISENHSRKLTAVVFEGVKSRWVYGSRVRSPGAHEKVWSIRNHEVVWSWDLWIGDWGEV